MIPLVLAASLVSVSPDAPPAPAPADRAAYESARAQAGTDPASQVRLALWCESHGFPAERLRHLAQAVLRDPGNTAARGLMGLVRYRDRWASPETVARQVGADADHAARMAEYHRRRDQAAPTADAQARLAAWCEENGLADEARAHHAVVLQLDPDRKVSRQRLGYRKEGRRWVTAEQLAAEKEDAALQKAADRQWKAKLGEWRGRLDDRGERRAEAEAGLAAVNDPRAVPAIIAVFARGGPSDRARAVRLLGQIDAAGSSRALAVLAVFDPEAEVRRAATETLKGRDIREFAGRLVALLRDSIAFEVRHVGGPGQPGALFVGGQRFNVQRMYAPPALNLDQIGPVSGARVDESGFLVLQRMLGAGTTELPWDREYGPDRQVSGISRVSESVAMDLVREENVLPDALRQFAPKAWEMATNNLNSSAATMMLKSRIRSEVAGSVDHKVNVHHGVDWRVWQEIPVGRMIAESQQAALSAEQQLQQDVAALESMNHQIRDNNDRVASVLGAVSGKSQSTSPADWRSWWIDQLGFRNDLAQQAAYVPTVVENVPLAYVPEAAPTIAGIVSPPRLVDFRAISCFGAGTLVRTLDGARPIETLRVGDRVLTASTADGSLGYQPITKVHHNPPSPTFLVKVAGDTIVSSPFHRFWVAGRGWVMARDLVGGETLRVLGSVGNIDAVETGPVQPVFNLDVADAHDFFAGRAAALVHDNTLPDTRLVPFDASDRRAD